MIWLSMPSRSTRCSTHVPLVSKISAAFSAPSHVRRRSHSILTLPYFSEYLIRQVLATKNFTNCVAVDVVHVNLASTLANSFFDSCRDVQFGATGQKVVDLLFQSPKRTLDFLDFLGLPGNSPFLINFTLVEDNVGLDALTVSCGSEDPKYACSCADCRATCERRAPPYLPPLPVAGECTLSWGGQPVACVTFGLAAAFIVLALVVAGVSLKTKLVVVQRMGTQKLHYNSKAFGARLAHKFFPHDDDHHGLFFNLGFFVARHAIAVIICAMAVTALLLIPVMLGQLHIETNPVNLWVNSDSRAAKDKAFFDANFGPFYRIEQLIITPRPNTSAFPLVLSGDVMRDVFEINSRVVNASVPYANNSSVSLRDICFQAVPGDGCTIQSVTEYWQNSAATFNASLPPPPTTAAAVDAAIRNYVAQCVIDATDEGCYTSTGIPIVMPAVLFGGVANRNYSGATALVITYLVNNNGSNMAAILAFEKEFLAIAAAPWPSVVVSFSAEVRLKGRSLVGCVAYVHAMLTRLADALMWAHRCHSALMASLHLISF